MKIAKPVPAFGAGFIAVAVFFLFSAAAVSAAVAAGVPETPPESRTERQIEGWTVRVDDRLLQPPNVEFGQRVLKFLEAKLSDITFVVSPERLAKLREVPIVLDLSHGQLRTMQYHPNAGWLAEHGYATNLVKCVHIPRAADLVTARNVNEQPWVILHELAHAYHDQVLGFDDPRILQAYERYRQSGHGEATLLFDGSRVRHYALTDHKEFFAEMTEAYFGENDFFPFNRAELMTAEPEMYELLQAIWGPVAGRLDKPPKPGKTSNIQKTSPAETATVLWPDQPVPGDVSGAHYDWQITKQPERPYLHPYYQTLVMKIFLAEKQPNEGCKVYLTFEQALAVIQRLDHITLGIPKIVYLVGWQHNGHDSKYPDWSVVNPRLKRAQDASALASLKWLMAEGFKYHTTVSLHINMFDAYADSPLWETYLTNDIIAKDKDGEPLPGEVMGSTPEELKHPRIDTQSYQISYAREWETGLARKRIDGLLAMLPIQKAGTIHIDAFHTYPPIPHAYPPDRYPDRDRTFKGVSPLLGYGPQEESAAQRKIFRYFRDQGVDVTSEGSTFLRPDAFVGLQPMAWDYVAPSAGIPPSLYCGTPMRAEPEIKKDPVGLTGLVSKFCLDVVPWYYRNNYADQSPALPRDGDELLAPVLWRKLTLVAFSGKGCPPRTWKLPVGWEGVRRVAVREIKPDGLKELAQLQVKDGTITFGLTSGQGVTITPTR